jgi:hypothetical protein
VTLSCSGYLKFPLPSHNEIGNKSTVWESGHYGRERRTDTLTRAILAGSAALGHGVSVAQYPVPAREDAHAGAETAMSAANTRVEFEKLFLPHLDAAYNLARLLTRNAQDAEDVVQESYLRAFRAFSGFRGEASRPWILTIVRNTSYLAARQSCPRRVRGVSRGTSR